MLKLSSSRYKDSTSTAYQRDYSSTYVDFKDFSGEIDIVQVKHDPLYATIKKKTGLLFV